MTDSKGEKKLAQARRGYILKVLKDGTASTYAEARKLAYDKFPTKRDMLSRDYEGSVNVAGIGGGSLKSVNHDFGKNAVVMDKVPESSLEQELKAIEKRYGVRVAYEKPEVEKESDSSDSEDSEPCSICSKFEADISKAEAESEDFVSELLEGSKESRLETLNQKYKKHLAESQEQEQEPESESEPSGQAKKLKVNKVEQAKAKTADKGFFEDLLSVD